MKPMMIILNSLAFLVGVAVPASLAKDIQVDGKSYNFTISDDVTFESKEEMEFYTFQWSSAPPQIALFMLNVNPVPLTAEELGSLADMQDATFEKTMKEQGHELKKNRTAVALGPFKGIQLEYVITHDTGVTVNQYMFVLHDGTAAWSGQLTSHGDADIARAHSILKSATKRASK